MGEGSGVGEGLCRVECQGFQASLNNGAKREYIINQSGFLFLLRLYSNCPLVPSPDSLLQPR